MSIRFGTDGWRAGIAEGFTFDNLGRLAQAISDYVNRQRPAAGAPKTSGVRRLIVGYDRRFMSDMYARFTAAILAANDIKVFLAERPVPTPAAAFAIREKALDGGIIITASHNPFYFNGLKFKTAEAAPADKEATNNIEALIGKKRVKSFDFDSAVRLKRIEYIDIDTAYVDFLKRRIDGGSIKRRSPRVLIDYMHGSGSGYIEKVLKGASRIEAVRSNADPLFGGVNPEPIPKNLRVSFSRIRTKRFDIGLALDGDADRIGALRPDGRYITSGQIISLLLLHLIEDRRLSGAVVKTISGTTLIERICEKYGLKVLETPIGFKHISLLMRKQDVLIGGEESGGIGFCGGMPERDGILSALLLIEMITERKKSIASIMEAMDREYGRFFYARLDIGHPPQKARVFLKKLGKRPPLKIGGKRVERVKTYDGIKFIMKDSSWLLLRFSGTEPLIRIYAESNSGRGVERLLEAGKRMIAKG